MTGFPPTGGLARPPERLPLSAALTTVGNVVAIGTAILLAILIATRFGASAGTDGYFAALGVFAVTSTLAQSWRTTIVARLGESQTPFGAFDRYCGAVAIIFALCSVPFVALSGPLASLLTGDLPPVAQDTARTSLLILWPAVAGQLLAGLAAGMLAVFDDYVRAAAAYPAGNITSIALFLALEPAIGIRALPVAVLAGSLLTALILVIALVRRGWRPSPSLLVEVDPNLRAAWLLVFSSLSVLALQLVHVISIAAASRVEEGAVTIWTYAFAGHGMVKVLTSLSMPIVIAAPIAATWDRRPRSLRPYQIDVMRTTFVLLIPALVAAVFLGDDIGEVLLTKFSAEDVDEIVTTFLILSVAIVASQASTVSNIGLLTLGRYGSMALISIPIIILHLGLSVGAAAIGSLAAVAAAQAATYTVRSATFVVLLHGRGSLRVVARLMVELVRIALPAAACFALGALLFHGGTLGDAAAYALGLALYAGVVAAMPDYRMLAARLLRAVRGSPTPALSDG